jgi:hypothetical protein
MDVGLARLETVRRRVLASRAVPPLSKDASSHGFAMAALLTAMSIMAIALAAALPAWQQMMQREKEGGTFLQPSAPRRRTGQRTARRFGSWRWTAHGGARRARNRALMRVTERSRGGGLH